MTPISKTFSLDISSKLDMYVTLPHVVFHVCLLCINFVKYTLTFSTNLQEYDRFNNEQRAQSCSYLFSMPYKYNWSNFGEDNLMENMYIFMIAIP